MADRVGDALREATQARERALSCGDEGIKTEWLKTATMWEEVAREYRRLDELEIRLHKQGGLLL